MGWDTSHLYEFKIKGDNYGRPDSDTIDDRRVKLNQVISRPRTKFIYIYDFGDWWEHELQLEKILRLKEGQFYPVCLEGERACPLEEVGGIWSYYNLLDIIQDPDHPENEEMAAWVGEDCDPEVFKLVGVNERLRRLN